MHYNYYFVLHTYILYETYRNMIIIKINAMIAEINVYDVYICIYLNFDILSDKIFYYYHYYYDRNHAKKQPSVRYNIILCYSNEERFAENRIYQIVHSSVQKSHSW